MGGGPKTERGSVWEGAPGSNPDSDANFLLVTLGRGWASLGSQAGVCGLSTRSFITLVLRNPSVCQTQAWERSGIPGPLSDWPAVGMCKIQSHKRIPMIQRDRISSSLQMESDSAPTGP